MKEIDIIIPAYNAHNTIGRTLSSIATQNITDKIKVTIVNDYSDKDYSEFVNSFSTLLDIQEITLEKNVGCGVARQTGLDNTNCEYIMFIDADDMLANPFTVQSLYESVKRPNGEYEVNIVYGDIIEISHSTGEIISKIQANHGTWVFGSIYRRSFIEKNNIRFNDSSRGEDVGFNKICKMLSHPEQVGLLDGITYFWTDANKNRINTQIFKNIYAKIGFLENIIYAYKVLGNRINSDNYSEYDIKIDSVANFVSLFFQYQELIEYAEDVKAELSVDEAKRLYIEFIDLCTDFYNLTYKKYEEIINDEDITFVYNLNISRIMNRGNISSKGISFFEFLNLLKNNKKDELKQKLLDELDK